MAVPLRARVGDLFERSCSIFWATSFTFDPLTFEEVWLRRLAPSALNATVLIDFGKLAEALADQRSRALRAINREYLVRGVSVPGGAFHPKTYLFGNGQRGTLAVASGNLGLQGFERGLEVFYLFDSDRPD